MSGQAKLSRVRTMKRWRRQAARIIAEACVEADIMCGLCQGLGFTDDDCECPRTIEESALSSGEIVETHVHHMEPDCSARCSVCGGAGDGRSAMTRALVSDPEQTFDVHLAREHAQRLVAMADEQAMFEDWASDLGWAGDPQAFGTDCPACREMLEIERAMRDRGATGTAACSWCADRTLGPRTGVVSGGYPGKLPRQWPGKPRAAMGRSLARLGQRLLDTLDGLCPWAPSAETQPSECDACDGAGIDPPMYWDGYEDDSCMLCHGTGHNLRGVLPAIEWSPAVRRKAVDSNHAYTYRDERARMGHSYPQQLAAALHQSFANEPAPTRVVPRGEHRALEASDMVEAIQRCTNRTAVLTGESDALWCPATTSHRRECLPRWVLGDQRRDW